MPKLLEKALRPLVLPLLALGMASAQAPPNDLLNRTVPRALRATNQSPLDVAHEVLLLARVAGGMVLSENAGIVTEVEVPERMPVTEALSRVLGGQDKYFWRDTNGVVDILPQRGTPTLLSTTIPFFEWKSSERPDGAVGRLQQLPEVLQRMALLGYVDGLHQGPGLQKPPRVGAPSEPSEAPQVFVRRNLTLLDLLNEIVKNASPPAIWRYVEVPQGRVRAVTLSAR